MSIVGYNANNGNTLGPNGAYVTFHGPFVAPASGTISDITAYVQTSGGATPLDFTYGIYSDSGGSPGTLLRATVGGSINDTTGGEHTQNLTSTLSVVSGTSYWFGVATPNIAYRFLKTAQSGFSAYYQAASYSSGSMPAVSSPTLFDNASEGHVYATITGGGAATAYTLSGPSSGVVNAASTNFTVTPNGTYTGTITPATGGAGTFTPSSLTWSADASAKTFTYTPTTTSGSPHSVSTTSSPGLTDPSPISYTVTAGTIAITAPVQYQWKRGGGSSVSFAVSGTYTGSVTHVEVSTDGSTWGTLDSSPSAGAYTGTVSLAASENDYTIAVRFSNSTGVTASVANIANLRIVIAYGGQSNEAGRGSGNQTVYNVVGSDTGRKKTAAGYALLADPTGTDGSAAGSYAIHECNILGATLGHRVGVCNFAVGGTSITQWQKGSGDGLYEALAAAVTAVGGAVDILHMGPWETDAIAGMSQATYHSGMASFRTSWFADFGTTKIVWRTGQHIDPAQATQPHQDNINAAILAAAGSTPGQATGDLGSVYLADVRSLPAYPGDTYHWLTDQQLADVGGIMAVVDYAAMNPTTGGGVSGSRIFGGF